MGPTDAQLPPHSSASPRNPAVLWQANDNKIPSSILQSLISNPETPKPAAQLFSRVQNIIVGDNALAVQAALQRAEKEGFQAESLGSDWQGEARDVGVDLAQKLRVSVEQKSRPFCLIAGGETTVTLKEFSSFWGGRRGDLESEGSFPPKHGTGGRNQELALGAVSELAGLENVLLISLASDGEDGPTDAAGAVVNGETLGSAEKLGLDVADHLSRHDAYPFFERLDDLLIIGPTGTNVVDLVFLLAW